MKRLIFILIIAIGFNTFAQEMNIITYNIRFNNPGDGENAWPKRKDLVGQLLNFYDPDIFGLQEALLGQIKDISNDLPDYKWIGVGREDGKQEGEYSPLFYNTKRLTLEDKGWFWLAGDCSKPELGWDAACKRICTWAILSEKQSGKKLLVLNTHFDHIGNIARSESAKLILRKIKEINTEDLPVVLTGDFNLSPESEPINLLKNELADSKDISEEPAYGPEGTFNSFNFNSPLDRRIDYVFVNKKVKVKKYAVLSDSKNEHYPSDHLPVFVRIEI